MQINRRKVHSLEYALRFLNNSLLTTHELMTLLQITTSITSTMIRVGEKKGGEGTSKKEERLGSWDHRESWESTQSGPWNYKYWPQKVKRALLIILLVNESNWQNRNKQASFGLSMKYIFKMLNSKIILDKKEHEYRSALDPASPKAVHSCTQHRNMGTGPNA